MDNRAVSSASDLRAENSLLLPLFAATVLLSSGLLFLVEPMFARLVLPRLGGSPSVWNACMVFFQTMLLLGYLYAHFSTRWLGARRHALWHFLVVLSPLVALPLTAGPGHPPTAVNPVWWLLWTLTLRAGLPFFALSASAPLLQRWFATLPVSSARDPYFLYAASNVGSVAALMAYPFVIEPSVGVARQTWLWSGGYVLFALAIGVCAVCVYRFGHDEHIENASDTATGAVTNRQRLSWTLLSLIPSSLMLGVTTHISTDVAAVPLLWVLPLALYLTTFVLAFMSREFVSFKWLVRLLPPLVLASLAAIFANIASLWLIGLHLATFFVCALACHRQLAIRRPSVQHLTEYYIWISFGGMLGGIFNTLLAPQLFSRILEYPLALAVAAFARPSPAFRRTAREPYLLLVGVPVLIAGIGTALWAAGLIDSTVGIQPLLLAFVSILAIAYMFVNRPEPFGVTALLAVVLIAFARPPSAGTILFAGRSFFGVHRVWDAPDHSYHLLQHGVTTHGRQQTAAVSRCEPTGYYHPAGPIGQLFASSPRAFRKVGVIGLGSGALSCYAHPGDAWTFYEIDPLIERIAEDSRYFTYLANSAAAVNIVLGDGRLTLQSALPGSYDLVVVDAFSSDAIPVHLLTREAVAFYFSRLTADGVVALHISNGYLNLEPVIGALSRQQELYALANLDRQIPEADAKLGRLSSHWVVLARTPERLAQLDRRTGWRPLQADRRVAAWTDDYSNILHVLNFH